MYAVQKLSDGKAFAAKFMQNSLDHLEECNIMLQMEDLHTINCEEFFVDIDDEFLKPMVVIFELAECDFNKYLSK